MVCGWCAGSADQTYRTSGKPICEMCLGKYKKLCDHFKDDIESHIVFASASNCKVRWILLGGKWTIESLKKWYREHWDDILKLRLFYGLYVGDDFMEVEEAAGSSVCTDWGGRYSMRWADLTRTAV